MNVTLKQLKYLVAVSEHAHFGRAATACYVTQSTLSAAVKDCEEALETKVFERLHNNVLITEAGNEVLIQAHRILKEVNDLEKLTAKSKSPLSGKLTLGVIPTIGPFLIPKILSALRVSYPEARIFLRESQTATLLSDLDSGKIDAALMAFPYPTKDLTIVPLFEDPFSLAFQKDNHLASLKHLKVKQLEGSDLLLLEEGHCLRQHALSACKLNSAKYGEPYQGTSLYTLVQMVANGLGVTLLPKMAIDSGILNNTDVKVKSFTEKNVQRTIGLAWRPTSTQQADLNLLASFIQKAQ